MLSGLATNLLVWLQHADIRRCECLHHCKNLYTATNFEIGVAPAARPGCLQAYETQAQYAAKLKGRAKELQACLQNAVDR